jgi:hypothetical protein
VKLRQPRTRPVVAFVGTVFDPVDRAGHGPPRPEQIAEVGVPVEQVGVAEPVEDRLQALRWEPALMSPWRAPMLLW